MVKYWRESPLSFLEPLLCTPPPIPSPENASCLAAQTLLFASSANKQLSPAGLCLLSHNPRWLGQKTRTIVGDTSCASLLLGTPILCCLFPSLEEKTVSFTVVYGARFTPAPLLCCGWQWIRMVLIWSPHIQSCRTHLVCSHCCSQSDFYMQIFPKLDQENVQTFIKV